MLCRHPPKSASQGSLALRKEKETVHHYSTYFLEDRDELAQVSTGKVLSFFYISLDYPDSCLKQ